MCTLCAERKCPNVPVLFHDEEFSQKVFNFQQELVDYCKCGGSQISTTWYTHRKGVTRCLSLVTIGISKEGLRIDDSLVIHQPVPFVLGEGVQFIGFSIPHDLVGFDDLGLAWFLLRLLDFVEDVLSHDVIVQLALAFAVEAETPHLAFDVTQFSLVAIVLGTRRHEFRNVVVGIQFTGKVAEVIAQGRVGLILVLQEDDRVRVVIQHTFP